jgi:hypothetical protein
MKTDRHPLFGFREKEHQAGLKNPILSVRGVVFLASSFLVLFTVIAFQFADYRITSFDKAFYEAHPDDNGHIDVWENHLREREEFGIERLAIFQIRIGFFAPLLAFCGYAFVFISALRAGKAGRQLFIIGSVLGIVCSGLVFLCHNLWMFFGIAHA